MLTIADLAGAAAHGCFVLFWRDEGAECEAALDVLNDLASSGGGEFRFVALSLDSSPRVAVAASPQVRWPALWHGWAAEAAVLKAISNLSVLPTLLLLEGKGCTIKHVVEGRLWKQGLEELIDAASKTARTKTGRRRREK